ncbi:hypothetical protein [Nocardia fluminea]|uniref:hypothetical protein n=1 Tax=Nocardia fluminea TaxID=134984 RepID=UPI003D139A1D
MEQSNARLDRIRNAGFAILSTDLGAAGPTIDETWRLVAGAAVTPDVSVPFSDSAASLTGTWLQVVRSNHIVSAADELLIAAPFQGGGADIQDWIPVRLTGNINLSSMVDAKGSVEFVGRSIEGTSYCGVTAEDDGYWVVSGKYPIPRPTTWIESTSWPPKGSTTLAELLDTIRGSSEVPQVKIAVAKVLHEIYGLPVSKAREITSVLDCFLCPTVTEDELEHLWRSAVAPDAVD